MTRVLMTRGRAAAVLVLLAALAARADSPSPKELVDGGHWKRAKAALEPLVQKNPGDAQLLSLLASVRSAYRDYKGALELAEKAAALDPKSAAYRGLVAETACSMAGQEQSFSWARRCKKELQAAVALDPKGNVSSRWGIIEFNMQAPWIVGGSKDDARKALEEIKRIDPVRGALAQARMNELEKKPDSPEPLYLQAYQADPRNFQTLVALINYYLNDRSRKLDQAERFAREALALEPGRTAPYAGLAVAAALQQQWPEVDAILADAERAVPDNLAPRFSVGRTLASKGIDLPRAERYLRAYLAAEPEPTAAQPAVVHYWLGITCEKMGRKADAIRELQESVRLNPESEQAKKDLKRLQG
jgi:tetratricopeptide (TPR) repeat protein